MWVSFGNILNVLLIIMAIKFLTYYLLDIIHIIFYKNFDECNVSRFDQMVGKMIIV